jgi:hypothetical protein
MQFWSKDTKMFYQNDKPKIATHKGLNSKDKLTISWLPLHIHGVFQMSIYSPKTRN